MLANRRAWVCAGTCAVAVAAQPVRASAQERLHFQELSDERMDDSTLQRLDPVEPWRFQAFGTLGGDARVGAVTGAVPTVAAGAGLGVWVDPTHFLQLRSEAVVPDAGTLGGGSFGWRDVEGFHRARANYGFGAVRDGELGADLSLEASASHSTAVSSSFLRPDVGPRPFLEARADATLWPRIGGGDDHAWVVPVTAGARRLELDTGSGTAGFTSTRVSSGVGIRDYRKAATGGWFELAGVGYEKATFDTTPSTAEKVDLRGLHFSHFVGASESDLLLDLESDIGGAWVWNAVDKSQTSTVAGKLGFGVRMFTDDGHHDWFEIGAAAARDAGWMADGSGLTQLWRIEAPAEISMLDDRVGGAVRVAAESLEIPVGFAAGRDGWRATFTTEWYFAPVPGLQVGAHHATTNACVLAGDSYCHTLGAFVRLTGGWPKPPADPPAETPAEEGEGPLQTMMATPTKDSAPVP
jgi:hypothetical protein